MSRISWKARALAAEAENRKLAAYAFDYGNATGRCAAGYLQQRGLICHHCGHDNSNDDPCPKIPEVKP